MAEWNPPYAEDELPGEALAAQRMPIDLPEDVEKEILIRTRHWFLDQVAAPQPTTSMFFSLRLATACALVLLTAGGGWWMTQGQVSPAVLLQEGMKPSARVAQKKWKHWQAPSSTSGMMKVAGHWEVEATAKSALSLSTPSRTHQQLLLRHGRVNVHVVPGQMKLFSVRAAGVRVIVKGTRFSVEKTKAWVRVEVTRGRVMAHHPSLDGQAVSAGQGCRFSLPKGARHCYSIPKQKQAIFARVKWFSQHQPSETMLYLRDMLSHPQLSLAQRKRLLAGSIQWFAKKGLSKLMREAYVLSFEKSSLDQAHAWLKAGQTCFKEQGQSRECLPLLQRCLGAKELGKSQWCEYGWGLLVKWGLQTSQSPSQQAEVAKQGLAYLSRHPAGSWKKDIKRIIIGVVKRQPKLCRTLGLQIKRGTPTRTWLNRLCRNRR